MGVQNQGTIITGSVRSGTTLALRIYCPSLTPRDEQGGSPYNEPQPLSNLIVWGMPSLALVLLPRTIQQTSYRLIKSPHIAFILPRVKPIYKVIVTFRDLRLTIPSMFNHPMVRKLDLSRIPFWIFYAESKKIPKSPLLKAAMAVEQYYKHIIRYPGPLEIWNYGFWDNWVIRNNDLKKLYQTNRGETSIEVLKDVKQGQTFSDARMTKCIWFNFCDRYGFNREEQSFVEETNYRIQDLYKKSNYSIKTLDDK